MSCGLASRRWTFAAALLVACSIAPARPGQAQETTPAVKEFETPALQISYDATLASSYLFQGIDYSEGRSVVQPNAAATWRGLTGNVWANLQAATLEPNEIDLSLKLEREAGRLTAAGGYLHLFYPNRDWDPSREVFLDLAWSGPAGPSLSVHYDFGQGDGAYTTFGLRHELPSGLSFAGNLFHQAGYYGMTGVCAAELRITASYALGTVTLTQSASYFRSWENGDFRGEAAIPSRWLVAINLAR